MVRVSGQDRKCPINLLQQHDSYKLMGPGPGAEGKRQVGPLAHGRAEAFGAAYGKEKARAA